QVERFAPGFRDRILARHTLRPADLERANPNYRGGAVTGGVADALQFWNRPVTRLDPYSTPNPRLYICSAATPPGGGVHGMCGYWAAQSALKRLDQRPYPREGPSSADEVGANVRTRWRSRLLDDPGALPGLHRDQISSLGARLRGRPGPG